MPRDEYHGIPIDRLRLRFVDWIHRADYIRTRTTRKALSQEINIEPAWAVQAATDPMALVALGDGDSVRVVGWSDAADRVLTVILVGKDIEGGESWGANAWASNKKEQQRYWKREE